MGELPGHHPAEITPRQKVARKATRAILSVALPQERQDADSNGLARAEQLHQEGYGIIVLINHFSRTDPIHAMEAMVKSPEFANQRISAPIAKHQAVTGIVGLGQATGIMLHEVVTQQTIESAEKKGKTQNLKLGDGNMPYVRDATQTLLDGGIVIMAPQATRRPILEFDPQKQPVRALLLWARNNPKIAIHFIALGIEGLGDYSKKRGTNIGTRYQIIHGPTFKRSEAEEQAGGGKDIDRWAFEELVKIVPKEYLPK